MAPYQYIKKSKSNAVVTLSQMGYDDDDSFFQTCSCEIKYLIEYNNLRNGGGSLLEIWGTRTFKSLEVNDTVKAA